MLADSERIFLFMYALLKSGIPKEEWWHCKFVVVHVQGPQFDFVRAVKKTDDDKELV